MARSPDPRLAGEVVRWHTLPMSRRDTVAEHSWNVARIVLAIHPSASRELIIEALMHDIGEVMTGDMPHLTKLQYPELRAGLMHCETIAREEMVQSWNVPAHRSISAHEHWVLGIADKLEMWEMGAEEVIRGSCLTGQEIMRATEKWIERAVSERPSIEELSVLSMMKGYMARRRAVWGIGERA